MHSHATNHRAVSREELRAVAATEWGRNVLAVNPGFRHIYDAVAKESSDGAARIRAIQALEDLYTPRFPWQSVHCRNLVEVLV